MLLVNASTTPKEFLVPSLAKTIDWCLFVNTAALPPHDVFADVNGPPLPATGRVRMVERSLRVYVAHGSRHNRVAGLHD